MGSGPAGITAAYYLRRRGYCVTIFEALDRLGGMLRVGIPDYRLPPELLDREIAHVLRTGIEVKTGQRLGRDFTLESLRTDGYSAVLLVIGAHLGMTAGIPGERDLDNVMNAVDWLRQINLGDRACPGRRVVVIGGGNVAVDAARVARRLGSESVAIVYRRTRQEMPAYAEEIEDALAEGIHIDYLTAPVRVVGNAGKVVGIECMRTELGPPDESGRRRPVPVAGSEFVIDCDAVIPAIGQKIDLGWAAGCEPLKTTPRGAIAVDPHTLQTSLPYVFAAGDAGAGRRPSSKPWPRATRRWRRSSDFSGSRIWRRWRSRPRRGWPPARIGPRSPRMSVVRNASAAGIWMRPRG